MLFLDKAIDKLVEDGTVRHVAVRVGLGNKILHDSFRGGVDEKTLFDMASVTKIIVTSTLAFIAIDRGLIALGDKVNRFFATDKPITVRHLLTHTMGIGHKDLTASGNSYENIGEKILEIRSDIPIGSNVLYSCPGYILLGKILEKVFDMPLDACFDELVANPLDLVDSSFLPKNRENAVNSNLEEEKRGVVNDYNCQHLGGVAGNAGLFSNIADVTKYVKLLQNRGAPLVEQSTFSEAVKNHTPEMSASRGLGFLYVDRRYAQACELFDDGAIGHCGHTGQSVFVDCKTGLYVIILTDATVSTVRKYGKENYDEVMSMRATLHKAIKEDVENERYNKIHGIRLNKQFKPVGTGVLDCP